MIKFLIVSGVISLYFAMVLSAYIILSKISPYNKNEDYFCEGDSNKAFSIFWPVFIPIFIIVLMIMGISKLFDTIRENITENH